MRRVSVLAVLTLVCAAAIAGLGWYAARTQRWLVEARVMAVRAAEEAAAVRQAVDVQSQIVELPDDGQAYHVTLVLHEDWRERPAERELVAMWETDPRLKSIKAQVHWHLWTPETSIYRARFRQAWPQVPTLVVQDGKGRVIWKASGENIPRTADEVAGPLLRIWRARPIYILPWRRPRPCPEPAPKPEPEPDVAPEPAPMPDVAPPVDEDLAGQPPVVVAVIVCVLACLVAGTVTAAVVVAKHLQPAFAAKR